jgi:PAS domain S-box-containing protein
MKIANKISLSFLIVGLVLTSIAGTIFYRIAKNSLQHSIYSNLAATVASRANHIETYLKMLETSVVQLSRSVVLEDLLEIINIAGKESIGYGKFYEEAMTRLRRTEEANPAINEFLLLDATGKVIASSNERSVGSDKSKDAIFLEGQKGTYIKDAYYSEDYKEPIIAVSVPFLSSNTGDFLGVFAARVGLNELNSIVAEKAGMGDTGEIYLVNKQGVMITPSRFKEDVVLKQKVDSENVRQARLHKGREHALSEKKKIAVFPNYRGAQVLGAHEYIPRMQWAVLAEIDAKEALAPLVKLRLVLSMTLIIVPIIAWLLGVFIAGFIAGPLHMLQKGTEIIGKGNLDYKMSINTRDEVGQLSRAFDAMVENLKHSVASIENLNKEITERKQAEEASKEAKAFTESTLNSITDIFYSFDLNGKFLSWNKTLNRISGYSDQELFSKKPTDFFLGEDIQRITETIERMYKEGTSKTDANFVLKDGRRIPCEFTSSILKDSKGNIIGFSGTGRDLTERKKAEEALSYFQKAVDSATDAIGMSTPEGRHYYQNEAFTKLFGLSVSEVDGASGPPGTVYADEKVGRKVFDIIMGGGFFEGEVKMLGKDRSEKDILQRAYSMKDKEGKVIGLVGIHTDITERKKADETLMKSEERFRLAAQSCTDLIYEWDLGTKIEWFGNLDELLGYARGEFPRTLEGWVNSVHPDDRNQVTVAIKNHLEKNELYDIEYRVRKKDGNYNYWQARGMAVRDKKGNPYRWIGAIADITERKKAEEALLAAKDYTENIIKSMFDTLIVINPDGKIKSINEAVTVLLGYKKEELIGKPFGTILAEEEEEEEEEEIPFIGTRLKKLINEGFIKEYNTAYKTKSGERIPVSLSGAVMRDKDDKLIGIIFIGRDLRDRKQAEEALRATYKKLQQAQQELIQASKMAAMGQLAAGISHELNQPLTGIKGFTQAVLADLEKESPFRNDLNKIVGQVDRMDTIIKNVRFFARKSDFDIVELDINQVILNSLMLLSQQLKTHNIRVIQEFDPDIPMIQGDPNQLQQAFLNIISNARDAILGLNRPEGGEIHIQSSLSQDKKHIEITFQDTGCGIPEGSLQHIFSPFFTTKSPDKGMGLGLSITYRIIENHQGKIDFKTKEGEGTTFNIAFPLKRAKDATMRS